MSGHCTGFTEVIGRNRSLGSNLLVHHVGFRVVNGIGVFSSSDELSNGGPICYRFMNIKPKQWKNVFLAKIGRTSTGWL